MGLGLLDPSGSPKSVSKCLLGWMSLAGQTADLYRILLDEETRSVWVIESPTCNRSLPYCTLLEVIWQMIVSGAVLMTDRLSYTRG